MDDWHEHDGVLLPSKEATWDQLLDAVSDPARLIEHTARDTYVRTGWYPTEFEFFLRWWMALDDWKIREVEYPIGTFDVSGSPDLIEELSKLVPLGEVRTAKEYFDETYHGP